MKFRFNIGLASVPINGVEEKRGEKRGGRREGGEIREMRGYAKPRKEKT